MIRLHALSSLCADGRHAFLVLHALEANLRSIWRSRSLEEGKRRQAPGTHVIFDPREDVRWPLSSASDAGDGEKAIQIQRSQAHMIGVSAATPKVSYRPRRRRRSACAAAEMVGTRITIRTWLAWANGASLVTALGM